ncbi:MAG: efflux RND transporter periplasmic adaptor subunit [Pseudomonadota bacterium]
MLRAALIALSCLTALPSLAQDMRGVLEPQALVEILPTVAGRIEAIPVREGDRLSAGTLLARIDARAQRARVSLAEVVAGATGAVSRAQAALTQATQVRDRVVKARASGAARTWEVEQAAQAVALAQAELTMAQDQVDQHQAQLTLENAVLKGFDIRMPFDGTVVEVSLTPGDVADPSTPILTVANLTRLEAVVFAPLAERARLTSGAVLPGLIPEMGDKPVEVTVLSIDPRLDSVSQTVRVRLGLETPNREVPPGATLVLRGGS